MSGVAAPINRADGGFKAGELHAGSSLVRLDYRPTPPLWPSRCSSAIFYAQSRSSCWRPSFRAPTIEIERTPTLRLQITGGIGKSGKAIYHRAIAPTLEICSCRNSRMYS